MPALGTNGAIDNRSIEDYSISNDWTQDHLIENNPGGLLSCWLARASSRIGPTSRRRRRKSPLFVWGVTWMKDDRWDDPPNVQLYSREGFGGPLSVGIRPINGTEYISVQGPHAH